MQISGYLPALALPPPSRETQARQPANDNLPDARQKSRRQTVEYVFDGEVIDERQAGTTAKTAYSQIIDPANQQAISSYAELQSLVPSRGRLLDIFI